MQAHQTGFDPGKVYVGQGSCQFEATDIAAGGTVRADVTVRNDNPSNGARADVRWVALDIDGQPTLFRQQGVQTPPNGRTPFFRDITMPAGEGPWPTAPYSTRIRAEVVEDTISSFAVSEPVIRGGSSLAKTIRRSTRY